MLRAVLRAYRWEYTVVMLWSFVIALLQLSGPFILRHLIIFIRSQSSDVRTGVILVLALVFT